MQIFFVYQAIALVESPVASHSCAEGMEVNMQTKLPAAINSVCSSVRRKKR